MSEQQQICDLLKSETVVRDESGRQLAYVVPAVIQFTRAGHLLPVDVLLGRDLGYFRQTRQYAVAVQVAQTAVDLMLHIQRGINAVVCAALRGKRLDLRRDA